MQSISKACREAIILDIETGESHRYSDILTAKAAAPKLKRALKLGDIIGGGPQRSYLVCWVDAVGRVLTNKAPHQITPDELDRAYLKALRIAPQDIDCWGCA